jgi:hypothetical protein
MDGNFTIRFSLLIHFSLLLGKEFAIILQGRRVHPAPPVDPGQTLGDRRVMWELLVMHGSPVYDARKNNALQMQEKRPTLGACSCCSLASPALRTSGLRNRHRLLRKPCEQERRVEALLSDAQKKRGQEMLRKALDLGD